MNHSWWGEFSAVFCALTWAIAVVIFKKVSGYISALHLNFVKNTLTSLLMIPTVYVVEGSLWLPPHLNRDMGIIVLSGVLGIGLADALYLKGLNIIGANKTAIVDTLYSPFIIILAIIFLGEHINFIQLAGIIMILMAVLMISWPAAQKKYNQAIATAPSKLSARLVWGYFCAITAIFLLAIGILIAKPYFNHIPIFSLIAIRLWAGSLLSAILIAPRIVQLRFWSDLFHNRNLKLIIFSSIIGTYISMIFWIMGFKYTKASIAAALNQLSTIFIVLLATIFLKETLSLRQIIATGLAFCGALILAYAT